MGAAFRHQPGALIVCAAAFVACACTQRPSLQSVRKAAKAERFINGLFTLEGIDIGAPVAGANALRVRVKNNQTTQLTLGVDIRAAAGMWFRAWQSQVAFDIPPEQTRVIQVGYQFFAVTPEATLRVRFGSAVRGTDGRPRLVEIAYERSYAVGTGNPATSWFGRSFRELKTQHLHLFAVTGSLAASRLRTIAAEREEALRQISAMLEVSPREDIRLVFYPDEEAKAAATGHKGIGLARGNLLVEVYNAKTQLDPYHELAHIVSDELGDPPALLNEGFATYVSERMGGSALQYLGHPGKSIEEVVRNLARSDQLIPLRELIRFTEIGSEASQPAVTYPQAASVVKFLIETYGLPPFRRALATLVNSEEPAEVERNAERWLRAYGQSLEQIEVSWRRTISDDARSDNAPLRSRRSARVIVGEH